jgi:hypothetical protein
MRDLEFGKQNGRCDGRPRSQINHLINNPVLPGLGSETWDLYRYLFSP